MSVRVVGDGPNDEPEALLADSGIGAESFFLLGALDWPLAGRANARSWDGRSAFVRELEVVAPDEG